MCVEIKRLFSEKDSCMVDRESELSVLKCFCLVVVITICSYKAVTPRAQYPLGGGPASSLPSPGTRSCYPETP